MIYVGANDGMLHAFYATLDVLDPLRGQEAWAVIPSAVLPNLYKLADDNYNHDGHQFYVDGTPVGRRRLDRQRWKTILVGGLNGGGKGYYALDVTVPGVPPMPLWEFKQNPAVCPGRRPRPAVGNYRRLQPRPDLRQAGHHQARRHLGGDGHLGLQQRQRRVQRCRRRRLPVRARRAHRRDHAQDPHREVAGINVGTAPTRAAWRRSTTTSTTSLVDNTTLRAYGGDLLGNIWRFDFTAGTATPPLGTAKDASTSGVPQPITIRPELAELNGKPFVMVGTGKLLGGSDVIDPQEQSVYGISDPLAGRGPIYPGSAARLAAADGRSSRPAAARRRRAPSSAPGTPPSAVAPTGWVLDLAEAGERVNVEMKLVLGALVFASNVPEEIPCTVGGHSWFNQVDFRFGTPIPNATSSEYLSDSLNVGFNVLQLQAVSGGNPTYSGNFRQSDAKNIKKDPQPPEPPPVGRRISWREIPQ